jgi:hypothetical protein
MKVKALFLTLFVSFGVAFATPPKGDLCHVYVIDTNAAKRAAAQYEKTNDPKSLGRAQTIYPSFETNIQEEVFTTKHYRLPRSRLFITASIFYTDESMGSKVGEKGEINPESMLLGITVTGNKEENAIFNQADNAVTEVGYDDHLSTVRVKKYLLINRKLYLVGLECDCNAKRESGK